MLRPVVYPYKMTSQSAKKLAQALNTKRVYPHKNYHPRCTHVIINWGSSVLPSWNCIGPTYLNRTSKVAIAANKRNTFNSFLLEGVKHPDWTDDKECAQSWIEQGHKVVCRQTLTGHSGSGIIIASTVEELVNAPLYVKFVKKDKEYRVHVFNSKIIDYQLKKKKHNYEGGLYGIRNHLNGWIYARSDVVLPEAIANESINAVQALGLDFGAVDICTGLDGQVYVFEVNTAPGLFGTTLEKYTQAIKELL